MHRVEHRRVIAVGV